MHLTRNTQTKVVMARIMRDATLHQENFSLKRYGTWEAAEMAAEKWVSERKSSLPESRKNEVGRMTSRNASGVVGVWLAKNVYRPKKGKRKIYWAWKSKWPGCELKGGLSWRITDDLIDDDAFVLAVLARKHRTVDREFLRWELLKEYGSNWHYEVLELKNAKPK
ncbi:hypothetical protein ACFPK9_04955 [Rubritalea spongiae]|uniref:AP2/ERF domain-containing protein n=1 Tax=Rubritalea spongiae TaxID=430797 RepID=A0ABW5E5E7_9BACT